MMASKLFRLVFACCLSRRTKELVSAAVLNVVDFELKLFPTNIQDIQDDRSRLIPATEPSMYVHPSLMQQAYFFLTKITVFV